MTNPLLRERPCVKVGCLVSVLSNEPCPFYLKQPEAAGNPSWGH